MNHCYSKTFLVTLLAIFFLISIPSAYAETTWSLPILQYKIDLQKIPEKQKKSAKENVLKIVKMRAAKLGIPKENVELVFLDNKNRIIVKLHEPASETLLEEINTELTKNVVLRFKEKWKIESEKWRNTSLSGKYIRHVEVQMDQYGMPQVLVQFTSRGKKLFRIITARNIGKPVGIFINDTLISQPIVQAEITGGEAVITGNFTLEEAEHLANDLNDGILPAPISIIE